MSFVSTQFALPSVTGPKGTVVPFAFAPGRCRVDVKRGIAPRALKTKGSSIRPTVPRTRLTVLPPSRLGELAGFWSSLANGIKGVAAGFATGGPVGAVVGGTAGAISGSVGSGKNNVQVVQQPQQQLGPLAGVSTGTIVGIAFGFSALLLVLARTGGR
jgi:hypothetical protein